MQRKWQVLLVLGLGVFVSSLDLFIVNIAFPDIRREFSGTGIGALSWVLNAYTIVFAAFLVPAGRWADAYGRKRVFLAGVALFVVASAACAAAPSVGALIALRAVQAIGAALLLPTSLGLLLPEFPPAERSMAVAIWASIGGVAAAAGPPIGGLLVELDWRWVFVVNVPVGVIAILAGSRLLHEVRDPSTTRPDAGGASLLALGVGALVAGIVQGPDWGWADARVVGAFVVAVALLAVVARRSQTHPAPVVEPALLRVRSFSIAIVASFLFYAAFGAMLLTSVLFLTGPWGRSVLDAGLQIAPGPAMATLLSVPGARLARRFGMAAVGVTGTVLFALGTVVWLTSLSGTPDYAGTFLPGMVITGVGVGLVLPTLMGAGTAGLAPERFSTGTAVISMSRQLGIAVGVAVLIALLGTPRTVDDFDAAFAFIALAAIGSGAVLLGLGRVEVHAGEPAPATG